MPTDAEDLRIANNALGFLGLGRITDFADANEAAETLDDQYTAWVSELIEDHPWNFAKRRSQLTHGMDFETSAVIFATNTFNNLTTYNFIDNLGPFRLTTTGTLPTGLALETNYWVTPTTPPAFSLTTEAGTVVTFSDTGSGTHTLTPYSLNEWDYSHLLPINCLQVVDIGESWDSYQWEVEQKFLLHNFGVSPIITYLKYVQMADVNNYLFKRALSLKIAMDLAESGIRTTSVDQNIEERFYKALQRAKSRDAQEASPMDQAVGSWAEEAGRES